MTQVEQVLNGAKAKIVTREKKEKRESGRSRAWCSRV